MSVFDDIFSSPEFHQQMAELREEHRKEEERKLKRAQEVMSKYSIIPWAEFQTRFGIAEREEDLNFHSTDVGELRFWTYYDAETDMQYVPLEDIIYMLDQINEMCLFGYLELGNDCNTLRPHQVFPDWFTDGSAEYTSKDCQSDVDEWDEQWEHFRKLQDEQVEEEPQPGLQEVLKQEAALKEFIEKGNPIRISLRLND
jgi:hypothetical protein